eukprot:c5882_g1_i1.p1 GENE.c5882_g1_i1~~c5882_g1_i1.p1  ORF type:complete len:219 (-),score=45.42 c5882_g1_i1:146-766(-)
MDGSTPTSSTSGLVDYDSIESQNSGSTNNLLKRSTRCPACQTLLSFPSNIQKSITCPRPWCKLRFNPMEEPNWPASQVAPPPRGKEQRFCHNCDTLCNYNKGVAFFICPKCQQTTFVDFAVYQRRSLCLSVIGVCLLLVGGFLIAGSTMFGWHAIVFPVLAVVLIAFGFLVIVRGVCLRRQTKVQSLKFRRTSEKTALLINVQHVS